MWRPGHKNARYLAIAAHKRGISTPVRDLLNFTPLKKIHERPGNSTAPCPRGGGVGAAQAVAGSKRLSTWNDFAVTSQDPRIKWSKR
jgi:hypothetical protein